MEGQPVYDVRAMSLAEILDTGFRIVRNHFGLLAGLQLVVSLPLALAGALVMPGHGAPLMSHWWAWGLLVLASLVMQPIAQTAITFALGEVYLGRDASIGDSLRKGVSVLMPLSATLLLYMIVIIGSFMLLVVPGVFAVLKLSLVWPVVVLEHVYGQAALKRSASLMKGQLWRAVALIVVTYLMTEVLGTVIGVTAGSIAGLKPFANGLANAVVETYSSVIWVVLYFDSRCRKEGFDLEHLAQLVAAEGTEPLSAVGRA